MIYSIRKFVQSRPQLAGPPAGADYVKNYVGIPRLSIALCLAFFDDNMGKQWILFQK